MVNGINKSQIIRYVDFSEKQDEAQIKKQLKDAPLFDDISSKDIYKKRIKAFDYFTDGHTVLEALATNRSAFQETFSLALSLAINEKYNSDNEYGSYCERREFFLNDLVLEDAINTNTISKWFLKQYNIKSPKFSKYLIKTFGEKASVVKLFNDRPIKTDDTVAEGKKLIISTLACNVMKMSAFNDFSSCQNYTHENDLGNLACVLASTHDENIGIAYITESDQEVICPYMLERMLLSTFAYKRQKFIVAWNNYYDTSNPILESSLKSLYGNRILFMHQLYQDEDMKSFKHKYDYELPVKVISKYGNDCAGHPYSNDEDVIDYDENEQIINISKSYLNLIIEREKETSKKDKSEEKSLEFSFR